MEALLILAATLLYSFQTLFCKLYSDRYPGRPELASPVFCALQSVVIVVITWAWQGFRFQADTVTLLLGVANALVIFGYNTAMIKASTRGSYAFMNVMLIFGGILVPIIYEALFLEGVMQWYRFGAVGLMLTACLLMNWKQITLKGAKLSYYLFCFLVFLFNGLFAVLMKMQSLHNEGQSKEMVIITYAVMGLLGFAQLALQEKKQTLKAFRMQGNAILPLAVCLLAGVLAINVLVLILPLVNASVFYTVENGGVLVLSALYSMVLFREKINLLGLLGIALALGSIILLCV